MMRNAMESEMNAANQLDQTAEQTIVRSRGPLIRPDGRLCIGKVAAPPRQEATSEQFYFWVPEDTLVEKTQIVTCESEIAGQWVTFYAVVDDVRRQSGKHSMSNEINEADGDLSF